MRKTSEFPPNSGMGAAEVSAERKNFIVAATAVVEQSKYIQSSLH